MNDEEDVEFEEKEGRRCGIGEEGRQETRCMQKEVKWERSENDEVVVTMTVKTTMHMELHLSMASYSALGLHWMNEKKEYEIVE